MLGNDLLQCSHAYAKDDIEEKNLRRCFNLCEHCNKSFRYHKVKQLKYKSEYQRVSQIRHKEYE